MDAEYADSPGADVRERRRLLGSGILAVAAMSAPLCMHVLRDAMRDIRRIRHRGRTPRLETDATAVD